MASPAPAAALADTTTVDLRWIAARVLQPLAYQPDSPALGAPLPGSGRPIVERPNAVLFTPAMLQPEKSFSASQTEDLSGPANFTGSSTTDSDVARSASLLDSAVAEASDSALPASLTTPSAAPALPTQQATYSGVLALLRSWEQDNHAAR